MAVNFDEPVCRLGTGSAKWDGKPMFQAMGITERADEETLPLFTADMDFRCPDSVRQEILKVAERNLYGYTILHPEICPEYYQAVIGWFRRRHHWEIKPDEILYVDGTIQAIRQALLAFSNPGDGVLITRPVYAPFSKAILSTGRQVVNSPLVNTDGYYTIDFEDFEKKAALTTTSCFILCSPHNPTGRIWTDEELRRMYEICTRHNVLVIADEIHGDLIRRDQVFHPLATLVDPQNLIACTAANKTFNLAGLKCTNVVIHDPDLRSRYAQQTGMIFLSPFTIAATIGAYNGGEEWLEELKSYLDESFEWALSFLKESMPKVKCLRPEGTYLLWMDFREYGLTSEEIHKRIYMDANVVLEGGSLFDPEKGAGFERICLSTRRELIQEAFQRIANAFQEC